MENLHQKFWALKPDQGLVQFSNRKTEHILSFKKKENIFSVHLFWVKTVPHKAQGTRVNTVSVSMYIIPGRLPPKCYFLQYWDKVAKSLILVGGYFHIPIFYYMASVAMILFPPEYDFRNSPRPLISSQPNFKSKTGNSKWFNTSFMFI